MGLKKGSRGRRGLEGKLSPVMGHVELEACAAFAGKVWWAVGNAVLRLCRKSLREH